MVQAMRVILAVPFVPRNSYIRHYDASNHYFAAQCLFEKDMDVLANGGGV